MSDKYYALKYGQTFIGTNPTRVIDGLTMCRFYNLVTSTATPDGVSIYVGNDASVTVNSGIELLSTDYLLVDAFGQNSNLYAICSSAPGATIGFIGLPSGESAADVVL